MKLLLFLLALLLTACDLTAEPVSATDYLEVLGDNRLVAKQDVYRVVLDVYSPDIPVEVESFYCTLTSLSLKLFRYTCTTEALTQGDYSPDSPRAYLFVRNWSRF